MDTPTPTPTPTDAWWMMLDNFVDLNSGASFPLTPGESEYLRGGFALLRDACPFGSGADERAEITDALVYAHPHWTGPRLAHAGVW